MFGSWATCVGELKAKDCRIKKEKEEKKWRSDKKEFQRLQGRKFPPILWTTVWKAEHRPFCVKSRGRVLLDTTNVSTMADFGFNGPICRSMVGKLNPKTSIKCFFLEKKNYRSCCQELNR